MFESGGEVLAQAWVWYDDSEGTIALDNIEVPDIYEKEVNYAKRKEVRACIKRLCDNFVATMRANGYKVNNVVIGCNATDMDTLGFDYFVETCQSHCCKCPFVVGGVLCYSDVASEGQFVVYRNGEPYTKEMGKAEKERLCLRALCRHTDSTGAERSWRAHVQGQSPTPSCLCTARFPTVRRCVLRHPPRT